MVWCGVVWCRHFLYGTESGAFGSLALDTTSARRGFTVTTGGGAGAGGGGGAGKRGGVSVLTMADVTKSGVSDVVVGRDDG